jgi:hypothetical protein
LCIDRWPLNPAFRGILIFCPLLIHDDTVSVVNYKQLFSYVFLDVERMAQPMLFFVTARFRLSFKLKGNP